jgi:hypothetical protein
MNYKPGDIIDITGVCNLSEEDAKNLNKGDLLVVVSDLCSTATVGEIVEFIRYDASSHYTVEHINARGRINANPAYMLSLVQKQKGQDLALRGVMYPTVGQAFPQVFNPNCDHSWTTYQGFTECYDYCTKCDTKRSEA